MGPNEQALSLLSNTSDKERLVELFSSIPRFLRPEIDTLISKTHVNPGIERKLLDTLFHYFDHHNGAIPEDLLQSFLDVTFSQLGEDRNANSLPSTREQACVVSEGQLDQLYIVLDLRLQLDKLSPGWFQSFLKLPTTTSDRIVKHFSLMTKAERSDLIEVAQHLEGRLEELVELYEASGASKDALTLAERQERQQFLLRFDGSLTYPHDNSSDVVNMLGPAPTRVAPLNGERSDLILRLGGKSEPHVWHVDVASQRLGIRPADPVPLDTTTMSKESRQTVYNYVANLGNDLEIHQTTGREKLALLQQRADLDREKAKWWANEAEHIKLRRAKERISRVQKSVRARTLRAAKAEQLDRDLQAQRAQEMEKEIERTQTILSAIQHASKWEEFERKQDQKKWQDRATLNALQSMRGVEEPDVDRRQHDGLSYLHSEWTGTGVPITAKAASNRFGTHEYKEPDVHDSIVTWKQQAKRCERVRDRQRRAKHRVALRAQTEGFSEQVKAWKEQASEIEEAKSVRLKNELLLKEQHLAERARMKGVAHQQREEMRRKADIRAAEEEARDREQLRRLAVERDREAQERRMFALEEAKQRVLDDFWGLPSHESYLEKLEEDKRKVWMARVKDRHKRMVQLRTSEADTEQETTEIRLQMEP